MASSSSLHRKRQARLTFSPLPSSSPAASSYPSQIRERAAAVGYSGSPAAKKRKVTIAEDTLKPDREDREDTNRHKDDEAIEALPTPERSSQLRNHGRRPHIDDESMSDGEPVRSTQRPLSQNIQSSQAKYGRVAQRRLDFSQHTGRSSSPARSSGPSLNMAAPVRAQTRSSAGLFKGRNTKAIELSSDSSEVSSDEALSDAQSPPRTQRSLISKRHTQSSPLHNAHSSPEATPRVTRSSQRPSQRKQTISISSDEEETDDLVIVGGKKRAAHHDIPEIPNIGEAETSGDDVTMSSPAKRRRPAGGSSTTTDRSNARAQNEPTQDDTEDEDDLPLPSSIRGQHHARNQQVVEYDDDEDVPATQRSRRRQKASGAPERRKSRQEQEDLAEDLEFLGSGGSAKSPTRLRSSAPTPKISARRTALELLKRRRAGEKVELSRSDEGGKQRPKRALYDTDSASGSDGRAGEEEDPDEVDEEPISAVHGDIAHDMFYEDDYDNDFVVEDEDDILGAPTELPLQFSSLGRAKSKDLFKYVVEWMVQKKINPAFASDDEVYGLAFRKLDDEVKGLADSKFTSSAWTPDFTKALQARPGITLTEISGPARTALLHHCDACNRRSHPATWDIQFYGRPYHEATMEEVSDDDDSEDSDSQSAENGTTVRPSYDSHGKEIPSEDRLFHVGQFCMRNARTAHALAHWRYHLNDWVVDYLKQEGYTSPEKIVERDNWNTKKRMKYANTIVDTMEESGEIRRLHHDFRLEIDTARNEKQAWSSRRRR